jgi:hypothetical protein
MKRIQLFEFEDFSWFPGAIRSSMTKLIVVFHKLMGTREVVQDLLNKVLKKNNYRQLVDLGSGSGGIMPEVLAGINAERDQKINLVMTDRHPNPEMVRRYNEDGDNGISYQTKPLDAADLKDAPKGVKTMMNSFHHMPPMVAKSILKNAEDNEQPIFIYEMGQNNIPLVLWWLLLPISLLVLMIMVLLMTPFVRPMTWQQLVFTYIIPIIPICYAWDGQASLVRMYTFEDIRELLGPNQHSNGYTWEIQAATKSNGKKLGYYIWGNPARK